MIKNWKSLFVKGQDAEPEKNENKADSFSFPVNNNTSTTQPAAQTYSAPANDPVINEVLQVYEAGLDSINMPGYDFYEFCRTRSSTSARSMKCTAST